MNGKKAMAIGIPVVVICVAALGYYMYISSFVKRWDNKIYPKAAIQGIDISGHTKEDAIAKVMEETSSVQNKKIVVTALGKTYTLDFKNSKPMYNIEEVINGIYSQGKDSGVITKYNMIRNSSPKNYELKFTYEDEAIKSFIDQIEKEVNKEAVNASISIKKTGIVTVNPDVKGQRLDKDYIMKEIASNIYSDEDIMLKAKIEDVSPAITASTLSQVNSIISSFSTNYSTSSAARAANIALAVKSINGILLMPGDSFSFNTAVGSRTAERGFQEAPVIIKNKLEPGQGGGVCQVSTTLYNAVIRANIRSSMRANHSLVPAYVPPGFDATVSDFIDYRFKNSLPYPIYIEGYARRGIICFNIYSNSSLNGVKYNLVNEIYERTEPVTVLKDDPNLQAGLKQQEEKPIPGMKVKVYLVGTANGIEVSRTLISNDKYNVVNEVIRLGTKRMR